jgi:hypothetical protein
MIYPVVSLNLLLLSRQALSAGQIYRRFSQSMLRLKVSQLLAHGTGTLAAVEGNAVLV